MHFFGPVGNDPKASTRAEVRFVIDTKTNSITIVNQRAGESVVSIWSFSFSAQGSVDAKAQSDTSGNFSVIIEARNGFAGFLGAPPPANVELNFSIVDGGVSFTGGSADPFFSLEVFLYGDQTVQVVNQEGTLDVEDLEKTKPLDPKTTDDTPVKPKEPGIPEKPKAAT